MEYLRIKQVLDTFNNHAHILIILHKNWIKRYFINSHFYHTMRRCVVHINDPDTTLTFDVNVIYWVFDTFSCPANNLFWFDIGLTYLAHACITMRRYVAHIHDPDTTLNFHLKVKFIGFFMTWVCVWAKAFLSRDIVILSLTHKCITMVRMWCTFMTSVWPWPQYQIIFSPWIWV